MYDVLKVIALSGCLASAACAANSVQTTEPADMVLLNGAFYTVDEGKPRAEAVAIDDGRFVYVGDVEGASAYIGEGTIQADLDGKFVVPGMIDGHTHPAINGLLSYDAFLPSGGHEETLQALRKIAEEKPGDGWLNLCCYPYPAYIGDGKTGPDKKHLDEIFPDRPVWIRSSSAHGSWLNSKALEMIGVTSETPDPAPYVAFYQRDEDGELTGWIAEGAGWQHAAAQFPTNPEKVKAAVDFGLQKLKEFGVTTVYDAGNFGHLDEVYSYLAELEAAGELDVRYDGTVMVFVPEARHAAIDEMKRLQTAYGGERLQFRTVKLFMDGVTPELAAGLIEPYTGYPDRPTSTSLSVEDLRDWMLDLHEAKLDLHVHAYGDLAVRRVLDAVELARAEVGESFYPRVTVAHLLLIDEADWPRFAELGVNANFTPHWHGTLEAEMPDGLIGPERADHIHPSNALLAAGANVTFSSDSFAPSKYNPMMGIQIAHNRRALEYRLPEGTGPDEFRGPESEKMDIHDMIVGYTRNGTIPFRTEEDLGTIAVGKLADLAILNASPFEVDRLAIADIVPDVVLMEGEVILGTLNP